MPTTRPSSPHARRARTGRDRTAAESSSRGVARAGAVGRAHRGRILGDRRAVEPEVALLVGDRQPAGAGLEKARGVQAASAGPVEGRLDAVAALDRAGGGGGVVERGDRRDSSAGSRLSTCSGSGCAAAIRASLRATASRSNESSSSSVVVEPLLPALAAGDRDRDVPDHAGGRDLVGGEPGVPRLRQPERHLAFAGPWRTRGSCRRALVPGRWSSSSQEVLNTLTRRNRAGAHPWLMALIWPGWPLPSASRPTFSQRAWPPMPSQEDQKSGVRLW